MTKKGKSADKTKALYIRCTEHDHAFVQTKAEELGLSLTELINRAVQQYQGVDTLRGRVDALESRMAALEASR